MSLLGIKFTVVGDELNIVWIKRKQNDPSQIDQYISKVRIQQEGNRTLSVSLEQLKNMFASSFVFGNLTIEQIVQEIIGHFNTIQGATDDILAQLPKNNFQFYKQQAKTYYDILINRDVQDITTNIAAKTKDFEKYDNAEILIKLVCWWYIRRLVHIYVVCTCLEKLIPKQPTPGAVTSAAYYNIQPTTTTTTVLNPPLTGVVSTDLNIDSLKKQLEAAQTYCLAMASDKTAVTNNFTSLKAQFDQLQMQWQDQQNVIKSLQDKISDYKELLLASTGMIFKMDEIPNLK
jgi:hypothetical protein